MIAVKSNLAVVILICITEKKICSKVVRGARHIILSKSLESLFHKHKSVWHEILVSSLQSFMTEISFAIKLLRKIMGKV